MKAHKFAFDFFTKKITLHQKQQLKTWAGACWQTQMWKYLMATCNMPSYESHGLLARDLAVNKYFALSESHRPSMPAGS
jgi:hypothetical protein